MDLNAFVDVQGELVLIECRDARALAFILFLFPDLTPERQEYCDDGTVMLWYRMDQDELACRVEMWQLESLRDFIQREHGLSLSIMGAEVVVDLGVGQYRAVQ